MKRGWAEVALIVCVVSAIVVAVRAQAGGQGAGQSTPVQPSAGTQKSGGAPVETAGQSSRFKNIKVLKDIPADQLLPSMEFIAASLGVDCGYCHVGQINGQDNYDKDDKRTKQTAREMMEMTLNINKTSFGGRNQVTCATCHQGHNEPRAVPPVLDEARLKERLEFEARLRQQQQQAQNQPAQPGQTNQPAPNQQQPNQAAQQQRQQAAQAAADQIFAKYEQAIGGTAAIDKFTSRVSTGTVTTGTGVKLKVTVQQKAPDKLLLSLVLPHGATQRLAYDGSTGWRAVGPQVGTLEGLDLLGMKVGAPFYRDLKLKSQCARAFALPQKQTVNGRELSVVRCQAPGNQVLENLFFDPDSGLLARRDTYFRTAVGPLMQETDYSDYRDVNGIKVAFTARQARADSLATRTWDEVKFNAPVEDSAFVMPKAETKP
jgi:photosynthetic reaction center cytochrome c subunit